MPIKLVFGIGPQTFDRVEIWRIGCVIPHIDTVLSGSSLHYLLVVHPQVVQEHGGGYFPIGFITAIQEFHELTGFDALIV